jgi:pseudouridine-5'-phosphate glycosidase
VSVVVAPEVRDALATARPVVALESTIFSPFGLPAPANVDALDRCLAAVRTGGAVPALTAVLDGRPRVGLDPAEHERILTGGAKVAARDLAVAMARSSAVGVTTVSAALALAAAAGISVFATGGIGGVHREVGHTGDVSADLGALAAHSLVTVSAGAKAFLDLPRTLEHLEMLGIPVLGWRTDEFPMFWCVSSGFPVPHRVDGEAQVAAVLRAQRALGLTGGVLLAVPIPAEAAIDRAEIEVVIASALATASATGAAVTPHVLAAIGHATGGRTVPANLALAEHNAAVAAAVAAEVARDATPP